MTGKKRRKPASLNDLAAALAAYHGQPGAVQAPAPADPLARGQEAQSIRLARMLLAK